MVYAPGLGDDVSVAASTEIPPVTLPPAVASEPPLVSLVIPTCNPAALPGMCSCR